jgi:hypothetical protein
MDKNWKMYIQVPTLLPSPPYAAMQGEACAWGSAGSTTVYVHQLASEAH